MSDKRVLSATDKIRRIAGWLDYSNESANDEIESVQHAEHLYDAALKSEWDVFADDIPEEAWELAKVGKVAEAAAEIDAWMRHREEGHVYRRRLVNEAAGCKHCAEFRKTMEEIEA